MSKTIAESWVMFRKCFKTETMTDQREAELRIAFYGGAASMFANFCVQHESEIGDAKEMVTGLKVEVSSFLEEMKLAKEMAERKIH